ncbi:MAG: thermonuclease family protein [Candidatus Omnitrophota bacterium]
MKKRHITKKEFKYIINIAALFLAVIVYFGTRFLPHQSCFASSPQQNSFVYVAKAIDGDTLRLSTGERVRLIGIDTPESRYNNKLERDSKRSKKDIKTIINMGKEAAAFTKQLVEGKKVRLELDVQKRDKYKRLLAYAYLEDGTFVNAKIVEEGYAQVLTIPPNVKHADTFLKLQREAREKHKGLWNEVATSNLF